MGKVIQFRRGRSARRAHFGGIVGLSLRKLWQSRLSAVPAVPVLLLASGVVGTVAIAVWPEQAESVVGARFSFCGPQPHRSCVMDGDTFYLGREPVRLADIDAPETHPPRCSYEAKLGAQATRRLHALLNAGPFELHSGMRDEDSHGRKIRTVVRDGRSLGSVMVSEGLARRWTGGREPWCS